MFVSGETGEPSAETTGIIEEIVRGQVIEMVLSLEAYFVVEILIRDSYNNAPILRHVAGPAPFLPTISSFSYVTIRRRFPAYEPIYPGKMLGKPLKIMTHLEELARLILPTFSTTRLQVLQVGLGQSR